MFTEKKYAEPARLFGNLVASVAAALGAAGALVTNVTDLTPERYKPQVTAAAAGIGAAAAALAKVQAWLTRNKVWSPEHHFESVREAEWISANRERQKVEYEQQVKPAVSWTPPDQ